MNNYLKSEWYRVIKGKGIYIFNFVLLGLLLTMNIFLCVIAHLEPDFPYATTKFAFSMISGAYMVGFFLSMVPASLAYGDESKFHTLKNTVGFGLSRTKIFFGKVIISMVTAFLSLIFVIGLFIGSSYLLLENSGVEYLNILLRGFAACIPLYLFAMLLSVVCCFIFDSGNKVFGMWMIICIGIPIITSILALKFDIFGKITSILPYYIINSVDTDLQTGITSFYWDTTKGMITCWLSGIGFTVLSIIVGYTKFIKTEVK